MRQCALVRISRSGCYYPPVGESAANLALMRLIDEAFLECPYYGSRQMMRHLRRLGHRVGPQSGAAADGQDGIGGDLPEAQYQRSRIPEHRIYPYLLRDLPIERPNQVWCADITYIPMRRGFLYLVAIMDWATRKVLAWRLSNTMDADFCIEALEEALARLRHAGDLQHRPGQPIHQPALHRRADARRRPDQHGRPGPLDGQCLHRAAVAVLKYECVYIHAFETGSALRAGLLKWIGYYNARAATLRADGRTPGRGV